MRRAWKWIAGGMWALGEFVTSTPLSFNPWSRNHHNFGWSILCAGLLMKFRFALAIVLTLATSTAFAQAQPTPASVAKLQPVVVTGSLIPHPEVETAQPLLTLTADDIKARGFASVADALQELSFATGSVHGMQDAQSGTTGAETLSLFGLPVGFTRYLIDGRPLADFPDLYKGSESFNSLGGIPMALVDHIDILPGGQSSLYGSDAIAGVINIVLKKRVGAPMLDLRYGWHKDGGGSDRRISFVDSFSANRFHSLLGLQFENTQPIWTRDRALTRQNYTEGSSPAVASRDFLVVSAGGKDAGYLFMDPYDCGRVGSQWGGTETRQHRPGYGDYCGSVRTPGAATLGNRVRQANLYSHNTFDLSDRQRLYGDLHYDYSEQKYAVQSYWGTDVVASQGSTFIYDPRMGDFLVLQHVFAPEENGGYQHTMNKETGNTWMLALGAEGALGRSDWDYDLQLSHAEDKLVDRDFHHFAAPLEQYYQDHVLGPHLGSFHDYPIFEPHYANLYSPILPADYDGFSGYTTSHAKTWDNQLRGQLTDTSLFALPGGDTSVALVLEGGNQGWDASPDPRLLATTTVYNGYVTPEIWGTRAVPGAGHRSRYAATSEFRLPLLRRLSMDLAGRYDSYRVAGGKVSRATYNLGLEYRPFKRLLLRGRYGTAFKAPTLADEFQGISGYHAAVTDYLNCARLGYRGPTLAACPFPYDGTPYSGQTAGNPQLHPVTAKAWSYGLVWLPLDSLSFAVDYLHWDIRNEVRQVSADQLSNTQYLCDTGALPAGSSTCANVPALITRGPSSDFNGVPLLGLITAIRTPKLNVADEQVDAVALNLGYHRPVTGFGTLSATLSWTDLLKHDYQDYATDPRRDLLRTPGPPAHNTDFKSRLNASLGWRSLGDRWSATLYASRDGRTPNYLAQTYGSYAAPGAGRLAPWIRWNASITYTPTHQISVSVLANNVFDAMPPADHSYPGTTAMPYNMLAYNVYGRALYVEASYSFNQH
jgi:iron complex outermembrane recepter protein